MSDQVLREDFRIPGWGVAYVIGLSVVSEAFALLTLGLVQSWGEVAPRWIPFIGGKNVRPMAAVTVSYYRRHRHQTPAMPHVGGPLGYMPQAPK